MALVSSTVSVYIFIVSWEIHKILRQINIIGTWGSMGGDGHEYGLRIIYLQIQILEKDSNFHSDACIITSSSILHSRTIEYLKVF